MSGSVAVSIILPTFNRARTIRRAIDSVLAQSFQDYELLVIDNGSTDGTLAAVRTYADPRVRYHPCHERRGPGAARNHGLELARGRHIAFIDSDDEWLPGKLALQVEVLENDDDDLGLVYTDMWWVSLRGTRVYHESPSVTPGRLLDSRLRFYQVYNVGIQSTLARRECVEAVGRFREDLACFEDMEFLIRFARRYRCHHLRKPMVNYIESRESVSKQRVEEIAVRAKLLDIFRHELARSFYYRERLTVLLCRYFELSDYFSKGNKRCRHSLLQWIKRPASPYVVRFKRKWIWAVSRIPGGVHLRVGAALHDADRPSRADAVVVLAPPRNNRLDKAFELTLAALAPEVLVFKSGHDRKFGGAASFGARRKAVTLMKSGVLDFISHRARTRPSTFTEISQIRDSLQKRYGRIIIVTDGFHTRRTRLVVDRVCARSAGRITIIAANAPGLGQDQWWQTLSGLRTYLREVVKLSCYRYVLLPGHSMIMRSPPGRPGRDRRSYGID